MHPRTLTKLGEDLKPCAQRRRALPHRTEPHAFCGRARIEPYAVIGYLHPDLLLGSPQGNPHVPGAGVTLALASASLTTSSTFSKSADILGVSFEQVGACNQAPTK
jgi:hypothetical protein